LHIDEKFVQDGQRCRSVEPEEFSKNLVETAKSPRRRSHTLALTTSSSVQPASVSVDLIVSRKSQAKLRGCRKMRVHPTRTWASGSRTLPSEDAAPLGRGQVPPGALSKRSGTEVEHGDAAAWSISSRQEITWTPITATRSPSKATNNPSAMAQRRLSIINHDARH